MSSRRGPLESILKMKLRYLKEFEIYPLLKFKKVKNSLKKLEFRSKFVNRMTLLLQLI